MGFHMEVGEMATCMGFCMEVVWSGEWQMHLSAFEICKFPEIFLLLLILLIDFFQYGFWMYRKAGHRKLRL